MARRASDGRDHRGRDGRDHRGRDGLGALLAAKEMIVVCGSGGVGKTTIAAALGLAATVEHGAKVLVLTVDPARRLADAMGLGPLGNNATQVPAELLDVVSDEVLDKPVSPARRDGGELWAAMLDTKKGWDALIRRHAPDAEVRDAVLANPLYQNITGRFVHSHDYLAMEQLHDVHASGEYDLVVIDTPPSRNALDVLDAPARMVEFFGSRLLRWLTVPYRSRLFTMASRPFYQVADRVLGSRFLQDIAEFFILFQAMEAGFVSRAREVEALLADPRTSFVVVSTLEAAPVHEAGYVAGELIDRGLPLGAIVANRVMPPGLTAESARAAASRLAEAATADGPLAAAVADALDLELDRSGDAEGGGLDAGDVAAVLEQAAAGFPDLAVVATREAERQAELATLATDTTDVVAVEALPGDVHDLHGLAAIARMLV